MIEAGTRPEDILKQLGIAEPKDLDVNAIAQFCGATILYEPLSGCEANIAGYGDKAIITVNSQSHPGRQRFSAGHELGHWMRDRGKSAFGCTPKQIDSEWDANNPETRANAFASDLLLPRHLFIPLAKDRPITLETLQDLATAFQMSKTATALKLVDLGSYPAMLIYYERGERKWFKRPRSVPSVLWPPERLPDDVLAAQLCEDGAVDNEASDDTRSDLWFDRQRAERYYLKESVFKTTDDSCAVMLWWEDEKQIIEIEEEEERKAARRSDDDWSRR